MNTASYLVGLIGFIVFITVFLVLQQFPIRANWFLLEIASGLIIHIPSSIAGFLFIEEFSYWYQASLYAFLWFCFFFITSIYSASVSVGIINYLYKQQQHTASLSDVYQNCVVNDFKERVEFLVATNQVQKTDRGYVITPTGRKTARQLQLINTVLGMQSQGFYSCDSTLLEYRTQINEKQ